MYLIVKYAYEDFLRNVLSISFNFKIQLENCYIKL